MILYAGKRTTEKNLQEQFFRFAVVVCDFLDHHFEVSGSTPCGEHYYSDVNANIASTDALVASMSAFILL